MDLIFDWVCLLPGFLVFTPGVLCHQGTKPWINLTDFVLIIPQRVRNGKYYQKHFTVYKILECLQSHCTALQNDSKIFTYMQK